MGRTGVWLARRIVAIALAIFGLVAGSSFTRQAYADAAQSALPDVDASQAFVATVHINLPMALPPGSENYQSPTDLPHDQTGTLTIARTANDAVHVIAADGLDALDQTLRVDSQGSVAQPSPPSSFIDALNYIAAVVAAEPVNAQAGAKWTVNVQVQSMGHKSPAVSVATIVELISAAGDVATIHAEGEKKNTDHQYTVDTSLKIDLTLKAGRVSDYVGTTTSGVDSPMVNIAIGETTSLKAK
jgi:hypothetical protein